MITTLPSKPKSPEGPPPPLLPPIKLSPSHEILKIDPKSKSKLLECPPLYREKNEGPLLNTMKQSKSYDGAQMKKMFYRLDKYKSKSFNSNLCKIDDLKLDD